MARDRATIEADLGRKMHEVSKEQEILVACQTRLKGLQAEASNLDKQLTKLDE